MLEDAASYQVPCVADANVKLVPVFHRDLRLVLAGILCVAAACAEDVTERLNQAAALLRDKEISRAVPILDGVRSTPSLKPIDRFRLGWLYGQSRRYETAIAMFEALPEDVPDPLTHYYAIALSYFNLARYDRTASVLTTAKQRGFTDARSANLLGVAYAKLGQAQKAYEALRGGVTGTAADPDGYLNLVTLCVDFGNNALAEKIATKGIEAFPSDARLVLSRGALRLAASQTEAARADFERAMQIAPRDPSPVFFAALGEYSSSQYADAIRILRKAIDAGVADAETHYLLAETLVRSDTDNDVEALRETDKAIAMDGALVPALLLRAKLELKKGDTRIAVRDLETARDMEPQNRNVLYLLGRAYQQTGNNAEAKKLFQHVQQDSANLVSDLAKKKMHKILVERPE
jgi:tetratricopeptide (TPR) repeat protein